MDTGVAFVSFLVLFGLALVAALFSCYHAQQRRNFQMAQLRQAAAAGRPATLLINTSMPHFGPFAALSLVRSNSVPPTQHLDQQDLTIQPRNLFPSYHICTGKTPTPPSIIQNLPVVVYESPTHTSSLAGRSDATSAGMKSAGATTEPQYSASTPAGSIDVDEGRAQCVICCCEYQTGELVKLLPCLHTFHEECIDAWLHRDHTCPICQADVILAAGYCMHDWSSHPSELEVQVRQQTSAAPATRVSSPATPPATPLQLEEAAAGGTSNSTWQAQQQQQHIELNCSPAGVNSTVLPVSTWNAAAMPTGHVVLTVGPARASFPADGGLPGSTHS